MPKAFLKSTTSVSISSSQYTLMTSLARKPFLTAQGRYVSTKRLLSPRRSVKAAKVARPVMGRRVLANSKALRATSPSRTTGRPVSAWTYAHSSSSTYRTCARVSGVTPSRSSQATYVAPTVPAGRERSRGRSSDAEVIRGRSRRIRRPVGEASMASRRRGTK
ncbi:hypothetical protein PgNI_10661 [Pyricularia grisea]|uniref:Uncharacterized protein n=1 Tax=Pyricularia grisea TaxID=148305 RepID=A0A6P8AZ39_PYRGI|nr:hypothetical protein PgNI_10661 [Pyricularia grisea]TLD07600.1 hypothetical protein PgNI_10661 [Pyricularia grisea]